MCWADRVAQLIVVIIVLFMAFMTAVGDGPGANIKNMLDTDLIFCAYTALPIWILLRIIDLMIGGPYRRRGQVSARILRP